MSEFTLNQFDPAASQLFLTSNKLYNLRSEKTFIKVMKETPKLRIDGMLTKQGDRPWKSENIYKQTHGIFIVNGVGYQAYFDNFKRPKTMFNFTDEGELCLMLIHSIVFQKKDMDNNKLFGPIKRNTAWGDRHFSFVLNIKLPNVDVLAARLMMDE